MNSQKMLDEVEGAQLGMGIVRSLIGIDADEVQNAAVKAWMDGNMKLFQQRAGLEVTGIPEPEGNTTVGHSVSIGNTNYYGNTQPAAAEPPVTAASNEPSAPAAPSSNGSGLLGKTALIAALLGATGAGAAATYAISNYTTGEKDTDSRTTITFPE